MRDEGLASDDETGATKPTGKFWSMIGGVSGGAMGFIVANVPGAMAGALAGNRLGAVRDKRGKAVYSVFQVCAVREGAWRRKMTNTCAAGTAAGG